MELVAACGALGAGRITASAYNLDARKALADAFGRAGKRLVPTDPINLKCTHLDLSGMGFAHEHVNGLAQLLRCDVNGSLTHLDLSGMGLTHEHAICLLQSDVNGSLAEVNLDGFALPVKQLKGTDPVESLDFSKTGLAVASASLIASCIKESGVLKELKCAPLAPLAIGFVSEPVETQLLPHCPRPSPLLQPPQQ